jgi:hypothetical protein
VRPARPPSQGGGRPKRLVARYTSYALPTIPGVQPPQPHYLMTGQGYYHPPMLVQAPPPPPLLLPAPPVITPQPGFVPVPMPQVYQSAPPQTQGAAGSMHPGYTYATPGAYPHQSAGQGYPFGGAHPAHQPGTTHPTADIHRPEPRTTTLGQRILRALRMPTGRASTVASSRSPSAERGRSERRRSSPDSRRSSRLRSSPDSRRTSRPRSSHDARRSSRPHSTRSARSRRLVSPPPRQVSPVSTQATVRSDDFVPNQDNIRGRHHRDVEDDVSSLSSDDAEVPGGGQDVQSNAAVRQSPEAVPLAAGRHNEGNQDSRRCVARSSILPRVSLIRVRT